MTNKDVFRSVLDVLFRNRNSHLFSGFPSRPAATSLDTRRMSSKGIMQSATPPLTTPRNIFEPSRTTHLQGKRETRCRRPLPGCLPKQFGFARPSEMKEQFVFLPGEFDYFFFETNAVTGVPIWAATGGSGMNTFFADLSRTFSTKSGSFDSLKCRCWCGSKPRVLRVVGCQHNVFPELKDRRPFLRNRHAVSS
jgi:hypothetical protein